MFTIYPSGPSPSKLDLNSIPLKLFPSETFISLIGWACLIIFCQTSIFVKILDDPWEMADVLKSLYFKKSDLLFYSRIVTLIFFLDKLKAKAIPTNPEPTIIMLCL